MGNFEKLVVLTVLFLSAIVLAVALNEGEAEAGDSGPLTVNSANLGAPTRSLDTGSARPETQTPSSTQRPEDSDRDEAPLQPSPAGSAAPQTGESTQVSRPALLNTEVRRTAEPASEAGTVESETERPRDSSGRPMILTDARGLESAALDEFRVYAIQADDTWDGLSRRFYGTGRYVANLRLANEEMEKLEPGIRMLVPVYDFSQVAESRKPLQPGLHPSTRPASNSRPGATRGAKSSTPSKAASQPAGQTAKPAQPQGAGVAASVHEVATGETLSTIALKVYGSARMWEVIFEANRDQLKSSDWLQVGMKLKIPAQTAAQIKRGPKLKETAAKSTTTTTTPKTKKGKVQ